MTNKTEFLKRHGKDTSESYSLAQIASMSGISKSILQKVYDRGIGAHKTNPSSVRNKQGKKGGPGPKMSKEQWAYARVYSFVNKVEGKKKLNHDKDLVKDI